LCLLLQHDEGWIATWKSKYWLPWCVARTRPVKNLVNLYQEFTSYKLRYVCTWDEVGSGAEQIKYLCTCAVLCCAAVWV
jgi:hypothetical protein